MGWGFTGKGRSRWRAAAAVVAGATLYQRLGERRDRGRFPPPGRMVDAAGHLLHWSDHGGSGVPIMIETGAGSLAVGWEAIIPDLAARGHVFSYDRAGMGWSEPGRLWPSDRAAADDLAAVMAATGETGPWVLVGHSLGGIYARLFQRHHPEAVAGLVLVDSSHEDMVAVIRADIGRWALAAQAVLGLAMVAAPRSLARLAVTTGVARPVVRRLVGGDTPAEQRRRAALYLRSAFRRAQMTELVSVPRFLAALRKGDRRLDALPLAVVTAADPPAGARSMMARLRPSWVSLQEDLAGLSTRSTRITATTGGHFVFLDDPKAVLAGLDWVLEQIDVSNR